MIQFNAAVRKDSFQGVLFFGVLAVMSGNIMKNTGIIVRENGIREEKV